MPNLSTALDDPKLLDGFRASLERARIEGGGLDADQFVQFMEDFWRKNPGFKNEHSSLNEEYEDLYWKAKWIALPFQPARDLPDMFEKRLEIAWSIPEYDLWERLREKLVKVSYEERDPLKKNILQALERGTVGAWVKEYLLTVGAPPVDSLKQSQYFAQNKHFNAAPPEKREKLRALFALVERLRLSTFSPEGYEEGSLVVEVNGKIMTVTGRAIEEPDNEILQMIKKMRAAPQTPEQARNRMMEIYRGDPNATKAVEAAEAKLATAVGSDAKRAAVELMVRLRPVGGKKPDPIELLAAVRSYARVASLPNLLRDVPAAAAYLTEAYKKKNQPQEIESLKVFPTSAEHISAFLQTAFADAGLDEAESGRVGMQIANLIKERGSDAYLEMAHYDSDEGQFRWSKAL